MTEETVEVGHAIIEFMAGDITRQDGFEAFSLESHLGTWHHIPRIAVLENRTARNRPNG